MDSEQFLRLDERIDQIKDNVAELKAETKLNSLLINEMRDDLKSSMITITRHVSGDDKIITAIHPLLESLKPMLEEHNLKKLKLRHRNEMLGLWSKRLGLILTIITAVGGLISIFASFHLL